MLHIAQYMAFATGGNDEAPIPRPRGKTTAEPNIDGEIGIKMEVKVLIVSYKKTLASTRFGWSKKYGSYDAIQSAWEETGAFTVMGVTEQGRPYTMNLFADGTALVTIEGGGELENRDYLELAERVWNSGAPAGWGTLMEANPNALTDIQSNAYPYSNPVFTDDGTMFLYISDNNSSDELQSVVSYAVKNGNGYDDNGALKAVRFYEESGAVGVTAATDIATIPAHFAVDQFDAYTEADETVHTLILGSDYRNIDGISKYDTINLESLPVESNSGSNYLNILEQNPVAYIKLGSGSFKENGIEADVSFDVEEVAPGLDLPVQFTITNTGTSKISSVKVSGLSEQAKNFEVSLLPNQSAALTVFYPVPEGAVRDLDYTITADEAEATGTLVLNRPDVGIAEMKLLRESDGTRDVQVRLTNDSNIPLSGSGKTVKLAFYKDSGHKNRIGGEYTVPSERFADIDEAPISIKQRLTSAILLALSRRSPKRA
jgi:hypothetical protein